VQDETQEGLYLLLLLLLLSAAGLHFSWIGLLQSK
jgi:hypothetical protein